MTTLSLPGPIEALNGGLFISPGFGTHPTRVIDSFEIIFVQNGRLELFEGEDSFRLESGRTLLLRPGVRHGGLSRYAPDTRFFWIHFRVNDLRNRASAVRVPRVACIRNPEDLVELFCRFISDQESGMLDPVSASELITIMLCMIAESGGKPRRRKEACESGSGGADLADSVRSIIDAGYGKKISTSSIARILDRNPDYLERVFREKTGISVTDAVNRRRTDAARAVLLSDRMKNINEVSYECGYTGPSYFHRMFRRITGLTPREYRSLYSRTHINTH